MRSFLTGFIEEEKLNEICNKNLRQEEAVRQFQQIVLKSGSDDLYLKILTYCIEKCENLSNLIEMMWIDMEDQNTILTQTQRSNMYSRFNDLVKNLDLCLNDQLISSLLCEYSTDDENISPTGESLVDILIRQNSKKFYYKVCMLLHEQRDKYKECVDFMSHNEENQQQMHESVHHSSLQELALVKSQLGVVKYAVGSVVLQFTEDIDQLKEMVIVVIEDNKQLRKELAEQKEKLTELQEIKVTNEQLTLRVQALENSSMEQSNLIREELNKQVELIKKKLAPFSLEPSLAVKEVQENYNHPWSGLSPVFPNEWGVYPTVNWQTLDGKHDWNEQWTNIIQEKYNYIDAPPLMLPVELGGWCVQLYIKFDKEFTMRGYIIVKDLHYDNAPPQQLDVHFKLNLLIEGIPPFVIDNIFRLKREDDSSSHLWLISPWVDKAWPLPVLTIEVKR